MPVWNQQNAKHLLSRALFGYTRQDLAKALSYSSVEEFVDKELLADQPAPPPPGTWVTEVPTNNSLEGVRYNELTYWWFDMMINQKLSMREKMVLFWHNHFVVGRDKIGYPQHMYINNILLRKYAFGNFKQFTKDMTIDPAMLYYLDGAYSGKAAPNENYARELMELFTLGIGNYTETDIKQAAFALAGWRVSGLTVRQDTNQISTINKTFLGKTGNFNYTNIVDIVFDQPACAEFISMKLFKEFVCYKTDEAFIKKMADVFRKNNYELKPLLRFMLTSDEFYKAEYIGSKIKTPMESTIGSLKLFGQTAISADDMAFIFSSVVNLQQYPFFPPDVRGWTGQRDWISTTTYVTRSSFSDTVVNGRTVSGKVTAMKVIPLDFARSFASSENASKLIDDVTEQFFTFPLSSRKKKILLDTMLDGTILANWSTNTPGADRRISNMLKAMMRFPEFQMT